MYKKIENNYENNKKLVQEEILALLDETIDEELTVLEGSTIAGVAREVLYANPFSN